MRLLSGLASFFFCWGSQPPLGFCFVGPVPGRTAVGVLDFGVHPVHSRVYLFLLSFFLFSLPFSQGTEKSSSVPKRSQRFRIFFFFKMGMGNFSVQLILNVLNVLNVFKVVTVFEE